MGSSNMCLKWVFLDVLLGVEYEKPMKEKRKRLAKEVWNYSKSDSYMYASLMVPQSSQVFLGTKIRSPCSGIYAFIIADFFFPVCKCAVYVHNCMLIIAISLIVS